MIHSKRLVLLNIAAIITILICTGGSQCLAQRGGDRPAPVTSGKDANSRDRLRRFRDPAATASSGTTSSEVVDTPAPRKGPLDINTLKYVLIDPKTRAITFVGKYDPDYATGPIPYADILKDALDNPYPSFSIEPDQQQQGRFDQMDKMITSDIRKMSDPNYCNEYGQKLVNLLLYDTSLGADNQRFFRNCAAAMGMSGDELKRMYDAAGGKITIPGTEVFQLAAKLMRGIGAPGAADGMLALMSDGTIEDKLRNMAKALSLTSQFEELEKRGLPAEEFKTEAIILCISQMCREFEAPENEIANVASSIRSGQQPTTAITGYMATQMSNFITNKSGAKMLNGLVLGPEVMAKLYNLSAPQSEMAFRNVAPDSQLGDILFKADYRLKSICTFPDARDKMPGHMTDLEFAQKEAAAKNYDLPAGIGVNVGHRLVPSDVKMRVSPNGDIVQFQDSQVEVIGWVRGMMGNKDSAAADFINTVTPKYADFLTQHYDEYAKVYPEWHKMSEVSKIIALARWAKKNNYTIKVENASGAKVPHPKTINGFWSMVFQVSGEKAYLTVVAHGGASFSSDEGEDWVKTQPDAEVTSDVLKQLVASTVFAEQSVNAAVAGNLEDARDLADKSARAMSGEIDLTKLPSLNDIPVPGEPVPYAEATSAIINEATDCLKTMDTAQKDLARAQQLTATSPDEAEKLKQQATQTQDKAQERLNEILSSVSTYKTDPSKAGAVVVALQSHSGVVSPVGGSTPSAASGTSTTQGAAANPTTPKPEDWSTKCSQWITELDEVNKQIASTQGVLLKLNASVQSDRKQFEEWEKSADDAFDRCVSMAADWAVDFSAGALSERYDTIYDLAKKLPNKPEDVIEKYRLLASLAKRLKEAKSTNDVAGLAARENKTEQELYETLRDGIGQISGLLGLDKTVPGLLWKYGSMTCDMAYNLTELYQGWKNVSALEENNARYAEAVKKLAARMRELQERAKELRQKIEAGEPSENLFQ